MRWRSTWFPLAAGILALGSALPAVSNPAVSNPAVSNPAISNDAGAVRAEPEFTEQALFAAGTEGYSCFRIPAIVEAADGSLLAFAEGRVTDCGDDGDIDLVLRRSTDGGQTWGPLQLVLAGNGDTRGNPSPVVDAATGRVVLIGTYNPGDDDTQRHPYVLHSDDNGATWSDPVDLSDELRLPEWDSWYATGPGHAIQLQHGPHAGRIVVGGNHEGDAGALRGAHLMISDDGGLTWRLGAVESRRDNTVKPQELSLLELRDGSIYAAARDQYGDEAGNRAYATSSDAGRTWDRPFTTLPEFTAPVVQGSVVRYDADRLLYSVPAHPVTREAMAVRSSYDEGGSWETWQEGRVIHWGPSAYSDLIRLDGDDVGLLYEAGETTPYEEIRFARFNAAYLDTPNGEPPGLPEPPEPGPTTPDLSERDNDGYVRGGATLTAGRFGQALDLDGSDDYVEVPWSTSLDLAAGDFTWTAWIRYADATGSHAIMWAYRVGAGTPSIWLRAEPGSSRIRGWIQTDLGSAQVTSAKAYNDGQWHFVALQRASGSFRLLVDGTPVGSAAGPAGSVTAGKELTIDGIHVGQRLDGVHRFHGAIDDVRVYARALTPKQLDQIRTSNSAVPGGLRLRLPGDRIDPPRETRS
jgi:sialidase-1